MNLQIKFTKRQLEAYRYLTDNKTNEILYGGGARGGKSWFGCTWGLTEAISKPNSAWLIAREELTKLRDTTLITFFKVCSKYGIKKDVDFTFNSQSYTATFTNGSIIFFREIKYIPSDPEFDRLGSYDLTGGFIDEAQQIHIKAINVLKGRFSVLSGNGWKTIPKMLYSCNPSKNWIYQDFYKPHRDGAIRPDRVFIQSLATDNPFVGQDYIDNLKKADKVTVERLLYGNFEYDDDPAKLIEYDKILDLWTNHAENGIKCITADIAFQGSDLFVVGAWNGLNLVEIRTMAKSDGQEVLDLINDMARKHQVPQSNIIYDADGVGGFIQGFLRTAQPFKNGSKALNKENYAHLKAQCEFTMADYINRGLIAIKTEKYRDQIIEELEQVKRDKVDSDKPLTTLPKEKIKELLGHSPDFMDMIKMRFLLVIRKVARVG